MDYGNMRIEGDDYFTSSFSRFMNPKAYSDAQSRGDIVWRGFSFGDGTCSKMAKTWSFDSSQKVNPNSPLPRRRKVCVEGVSTEASYSLNETRLTLTETRRSQAYEGKGKHFRYIGKAKLSTATTSCVEQN